LGEAGETGLNQILQAQVFTLPAVPLVLAQKPDKKIRSDSALRELVHAPWISSLYLH
jgi:hypothetical protein